MGLYMLVADGEEGAEVYSGATTEKQAWEVYGPAQIMAKRAEASWSTTAVDVRAKNMNLIGSASRFEPLIGDPATARRRTAPSLTNTTSTTARACTIP